MVATVSITVWVVFGAVLALSLALIGKLVLTLIGRLKELRAATADAAERLSASTARVNELLGDLNDGMARLQSRRLRDR